MNIIYYISAGTVRITGKSVRGDSPGITFVLLTFQMTLIELKRLKDKITGPFIWHIRRDILTNFIIPDSNLIYLIWFLLTHELEHLALDIKEAGEESTYETIMEAVENYHKGNEILADALAKISE